MAPAETARPMRSNTKQKRSDEREAVSIFDCRDLFETVNPDTAADMSRVISEDMPVSESGSGLIFTKIAHISDEINIITPQIKAPISTE